MADPRVAVLLASYNGAEWISRQIESILDSRFVDVHVFLSDDGSSDGTVDIARTAGRDRLTVLPTARSGSAAQNFIRLVMDAPWDSFDYVALSDQDDIWLADKLSRAVSRIQDHNLDAYSSDVVAFWADGKRRYIRKSQPLQRWDHLFESAGPGNTFVFPVESAAFLRDRMGEADRTKLRIVARHDWLFYAYFREAAKRWMIDPISGVEYRQHAVNVAGAPTGLRAKLARAALVKSGWYRTQVLTISELTGASNIIIDYIKRPEIRHLGRILRHARSFRRRLSEALTVSLMLVMMALLKESQ